ncbi:cyclin-D1-binding protein 1 isoform X3 [Monodelphis domestica]|uniref:cyclin-D1-binding protein 1 isoform X3 n=1 Tax=Monodelphis domestica TaxID=13616 RepID=UPI0024E1DE1F|nr:cyclin-D1-binding protein 1 isoform X3 [Monodelphis domestica]
MARLGKPQRHSMRTDFGTSSRALAVSQEATKLSLAFARPPLPSSEDCRKLCESIQNAVLAEVSAYYWLPKDQGITLRKMVRDTIVDVVEGMAQLAEVIVRARPQCISHEYLISTGSIWETCDQVSHLPKDNKAAALLMLASYLRVVKDALEEMEQAQGDSGDPYSDILEDDELGSRGNRDTYWSEEDQQLLAPCVGLMKASKACLKKVRSSVETHGKTVVADQIAQLDDIVDISNEISPSCILLETMSGFSCLEGIEAGDERKRPEYLSPICYLLVDELALSMYPPLNRMAVRLNAAKLASVLKKVLEITKASHVCPHEEENWIQFLSSAIDHNMNKIKNLTQGEL